MDYIAVHIGIVPFSEEKADIIIAETSDLGYESFTQEGESLDAFIPRDKFSEQDLKTVLGGLFQGEAAVSYTLEFIREQNWNAVWESDFEPVVVRDTVTVKAKYHKDLPKTKYNIVIDPGMSFGSGHHQTTCMMIESMLDEGRLLRGRSVLDMGCGTGILSIVAAKLGASAPVRAIDIDPVCVRSALANARRNRVDHKIITICGDASSIPASTFDIVLANINRNILLEDMSTYVCSLKRGGVLFMSGFYTEDIDMLVEKGASLGLEKVSQMERDNWACIKMKLV